MKIENKNELLLTSLLKFYKKTQNMKTLHKYVSKSSPISLRVFDFLCTKYIKNKNVIYYVEKKGKKIPFNLSVAYKAQLKAYSKLQFDPFKRHDRIEIACTYCKEGKLVTTIGQLNFFKFAIENKLTDWIEIPENFIKVKKEISQDSNSKQSSTKSVKKMISSTSNLHITVTFK